ncbi:MAG: nucleotidyltransferase family protein [Clostridiales bacterium]|nr:nucleotidyltransferase family protein [Clostridiales bacterium]
MNATEYFIYLLACHLNAVEPKGEKRLDWQQIYNIAERNNLTAVIAYEIKRLPADCRPSGTIGAWFNESYENTIHSFRPNLQSLSNFINILTEERIDHALFKGVVLRNYYPFPELRVSSDMDILIRPADYVNVIEVLKKRGFVEKSIESNKATLQFEKDIFELHTELESINIQSKIYFATPFDDISDSTGCTYKLTPVYHLLYLVSHIAHHLQTGYATIKMIMDIDVLIRKFPDININEFLILSDNIKIGKTAETLLAFSKKIFNTPVVLNFTFEDEDTLPLYNDFVTAFLTGRVLGVHEENEDSAENKNALGFVKSIFDKFSKTKKQETELSYYQVQILEELGLKEAEEE